MVETTMAHAQLIPTACHSEGLADILERVLDKGVVIAGDIKIKLCDIELLTIQIRLLIASVDKAREMGLTWWWQPPQQPPPPPVHCRHGLPAACPFRPRRLRGSTICNSGNLPRRTARRRPPVWASQDSPSSAAVHAAKMGQSPICSSPLHPESRKDLAMAKSTKGPAQRPPPDDSNRRRARRDLGFNFGGFLGKLGSVMEKLVDLAETGQTLSQDRRAQGPRPAGQTPRRLRLLHQDGIWATRASGKSRSSPSATSAGESSGETVVEDVREPLVDVHEEEDHVLVLAEIPGVSKKDVQLELAERPLDDPRPAGREAISQGSRPAGQFLPEKMHWECTNGILKIRLER